MMIIFFIFQLPGFPLFGTGQTSVEGFEKCLEPVLKKYGDEKHIFWVNLRSVNDDLCPKFLSPHLHVKYPGRM